MTRILFVCLGNICRSPSAEAVTSHLAAQHGMALTCDSAGTGDWHIGKAPYGPMQAAATPRGYDMAHLQARQVEASDFRRFDLILAMDGQNLRDLQALAPADAKAELRLFTEFAGGRVGDDVPDPYYTRDFEGALDLIEDCAAGLVRHLQKLN